MAQERTRDVQTVTVIGSETMFRPDGRASIRLDTQELGAIVFEIDQRAFDALRKHLSNAEQFLRQTAGRA
jgi:hypothetical protein